VRGSCTLEGTGRSGGDVVSGPHPKRDARRRRALPPPGAPRSARANQSRTHRGRRNRAVVRASRRAAASALRAEVGAIRRDSAGEKCVVSFMARPCRTPKRHRRTRSDVESGVQGGAQRWDRRPAKQLSETLARCVRRHREISGGRRFRVSTARVRHVISGLQFIRRKARRRDRSKTQRRHVLRLCSGAWGTVDRNLRNAAVKRMQSDSSIRARVWRAGGGRPAPLAAEPSAGRARCESVQTPPTIPRATCRPLRAPLTHARTSIAGLQRCGGGITSHPLIEWRLVGSSTSSGLRPDYWPTTTGSDSRGHPRRRYALDSSFASSKWRSGSGEWSGARGPRLISRIPARSCPIAGCSSPLTAGRAVGGDFYDVIELRSSLARHRRCDDKASRAMVMAAPQRPACQRGAPP